MQLLTLSQSICLIFCVFIVSQVKTNVLTDEDEDFDLIERQTQLITAGFSSVFWSSVRRSITSSSNVSSQCSFHLDKLIQSTLAGQPWAFKLLSASGSRPNNFLEGTYAAFGSYDSCLAVSASFGIDEEETIKGKYCLTSLEPDFSDDPIKANLFGQIYPHIFDSTYNLTVKVGLCVPSSCSSTDVDQLMKKALSEYSWKLVDVHQCEVETTFPNRLKSAKFGQKVFMLLLTLLIMIIVLGTLIDIKARSTPFPSANPKTLTFWIQQFSVVKSVRSLFRKPADSPRVLVLDQLRVVSLVLVLIIHAFMWFTMIYTPFIAEDIKKGLEVIKKPDIQPWINDWATEGLMFIGGASAATNLLYKMKPETPITVYLYTIFRRAALLTPAMLVLIGIDVVSPFFGSGPIYNPINQYRSDVCVKNFMYNILHIQNQCNQLEVCASHTWSFAVEWQLFILMCVAIYIYKRNSHLGIVFNVFMVLFGFYRVNSIFYNYNIIPNFVMANFNAREFADRMSNYYIATGSHIWSYFWSLLLVVIMLGNYESKIDKIRPQLTKIVVGLTILQSYSSIPWNVFGMKVETTTTIIFVTICKIISGLFFAVIVLPYGKQFRQFLANSRSNDMQVYIEDDINQNTSFSQEELKEQSSEQCVKAVECNSQSLTNKNLHLFEIILRILKSSYFIHATIYSWYYTSLRTTLSSNFSNYLMNVAVLSVSAILGGFFFYVLIIGPVERITLVSSKKAKPVKSHTS